MGATVGGSNGVSTAAGATVGGSSGVSAGLGATVGGSGGVTAGLGATVGGNRGVNAGLGANIGGNSGIDTSVGIGIGDGEPGGGVTIGTNSRPNANPANPFEGDAVDSGGIGNGIDRTGGVAAMQQANQAPYNPYTDDSSFVAFSDDNEAAQDGAESRSFVERNRCTTRVCLRRLRHHRH